VFQPQETLYLGDKPPPAVQGEGQPQEGGKPRCPWAQRRASPHVVWVSTGAVATPCHCCPSFSLAPCQCLAFGTWPDPSGSAQMCTWAQELTRMLGLQGQAWGPGTLRSPGGLQGWAASAPFNLLHFWNHKCPSVPHPAWDGPSVFTNPSPGDTRATWQAPQGYRLLCRKCLLERGDRTGLETQPGELGA
jgi:hypothetical protein